MWSGAAGARAGACDCEQRALGRLRVVGSGGRSGGCMRLVRRAFVLMELVRLGAVGWFDDVFCVQATPDRVYNNFRT